MGLGQNERQIHESYSAINTTMVFSYNLEKHFKNHWFCDYFSGIERCQ